MMRYIDICNGDADGLCAVLQWRLHAPAQACLVTGLKRDIALLDRVQAGQGDELLVCDISMQRNRVALLRLLEQGARVRYFDHHAAPDAPAHPNLEAHVEFGSRVCTSLLMDRHLAGAHRAWALVGAYGDNLTEVADTLAVGAGLASEDRARLRLLGEAINYNAYGEDEQDVHVAPARLYAIMARYHDPLDLLVHEPVAQQLDALRRADLELGEDLAPHWENDSACVVVLPDVPWSRRVIGSLANRLASKHPQRAHAVLKPLRDGGFVVSVRAPLATPGGANELCGRFGGAGRAAAAGIDLLPDHDLERFISEFDAFPFHLCVRP
ncbi:MAG: hypothetical protein JHC40_17715 [Burkholderiales bacterium]|jgi:single-stranded DNA-specific DHH superfamily exonuclease|nr:hypothetical protein [Burkholderiales bacterium]